MNIRKNKWVCSDLMTFVLIPIIFTGCATVVMRRTIASKQNSKNDQIQLTDMPITFIQIIPGYSENLLLFSPLPFLPLPIIPWPVGIVNAITGYPGLKQENPNLKIGISISSEKIPKWNHAYLFRWNLTCLKAQM